MIVLHPKINYSIFIRTILFSRKFSDFKVKPAKVYPLNSFEYDFYNVWYDSGHFQPKKKRNTFSLLLPPPNVTGVLHLGHALTVTIQDALARWSRMCGNEVVWVPGCDHAGIATQAVVDKHLEKKGIFRVSLGRKKFVEEVLKWKEEKESVISNQLMSLGSSLDWKRKYFTMDNAQCDAVYDALLILWNKGLIYRDETLVNWSPHLRSTISDIEVNYVEIDGPTLFSLPGYSRQIEFGNILDFAYKVVGSDDEIVVSTTRIETMLGDVAVAVNPNDERYRHLWGSVLSHPFNGTEIPLVLDYNVDPNFGTGALKITPSHDRKDFLIGKSHNLPGLSVINEEGLLENSGIFSGMKRFDARDAISEALASKGLLRGSRPHKMNVPICSRSGDVVELLLKPQWFLKCKGMAERAVSVVKEQKLIITPEKYCANWYHWLDNIQDWCISRQLWWGHQVPFYCCERNGKENWLIARNDNVANEIVKTSFPGSVTCTRCPDVLDTWFSSALLPFSCFGWPKKTEDLARYYPLSTLVTGNDILFFWVARMVMLGLELTDQIPFKEILLHGIICDSQGRKMSKSIGNVIEPEDVIKGKTLKELSERISNSFLNKIEIERANKELQKLYPNGISQCGVDALRFTLLSYNIKNQYIHFDIKDCELNKRFCNKLWQACNFANTWYEKYSLHKENLDGNYKTQSLMDEWIILKLHSTINTVNKSFHQKDFHIATNILRNFIHHELCDVYIESIKPVLQNGKRQEIIQVIQILMHVLEASIKCLSPFMPFVTEYLYQMLPSPKNKSLMESTFPTADAKVMNSAIIDRVSHALNIINCIRRLKQSMQSNQKLEIWLSTNSDVEDFKNIIENLAKCKLTFGIPDMEQNAWKKETLNEETTIFHNLQEFNIKNKLDVYSLSKKKEKMEKELEKIIKMTSNEGYQKVKSSIKQTHMEKIYKLKTEINEMESTIRNAFKVQ